MANTRWGAGECRECGTAFEKRHRTALFCTSACKQRFNNRRRERGAELYDMAMAGERDIVTRLLSAYKAADKAQRGGRPSYQDSDMAMTRIPFGFGVGGDGR